jgi:hypothetical protein
VGRRKLSSIGNLVWLIPPSKRFDETDKIAIAFERMDHELSDYESLNEVTLMKRC